MSQFDNIALGYPLPKRKKFIQDLVSSKGADSQYSINLTFQKRSQIFPVYVVPLTLPKYRLENGRTQASQESYLATNPKLSPDFFRQDKESEEAQRIQHQLLYDMLDKNNLMGYFKDSDNKQTEPLILTNEGYVVNGNRRLCAMRMLYLENKDRYSHFANVDVVVLPHCAPQDIDELEAYLQVQQDIKARYTWIAEACMMRARRQDYHYDNETLAGIYGKTEKEVAAIFQRLGFVDEYLKSIGKEKQYGIVEQNETAFKQIQKIRPQVRDDGLKDLVTQLSYVLIEKSNDVSGRLYERIPELKENLDEITKKLSKELDISKEVKSSKGEYGLFGHSISPVSPIISAILKPENKSIAIDIAIDVIDGQKEKKRQKKKVDSVLHEVSEANSHLQTAANFISDEVVSKAGVLEQVTSIENSIKVIKKWLDSDD